MTAYSKTHFVIKRVFAGFKVMINHNTRWARKQSGPMPVVFPLYRCRETDTHLIVEEV